MFMFPEHPLSYVLIVKSRRTDYWLRYLPIYHIWYRVIRSASPQVTSQVHSPAHHSAGLVAPVTIEDLESTSDQHFVVRGDSIPTMTSSLSEPK